MVACLSPSGYTLAMMLQVGDQFDRDQMYSHSAQGNGWLSTLQHNPDDRDPAMRIFLMTSLTLIRSMQTSSAQEQVNKQPFPCGR